MPADFDISPIIPPTHPAVVHPFQTPSNRILKWLILVAVGLFLITVGSLWWGGNSFSDKGVELTIQGPDRATSGDQATYMVTWKNATKVALTSMNFRLFYPDGSIVLKDGQPTTPETDGFMVDRLEPGQFGSREFTFFLVGDKGAIKTMRIQLLFNAGTLRSSFEKEATIATTITALPVNLALVAPPSSVPSQPIQYILDVRNDTATDLADLKIVFTYPDGFVVQNLQPKPDVGNAEWIVDQLKAGRATRITVAGVLSGNERETKIVSASIQHKLNGQYVDYVRTEAFTVISSPLMAVNITPGSSRDYISFAGDTLRYTIRYENSSQFTFSGVTLAVKLDGDMYDFANIEIDKGFFNDSAKTVVYDSSGVPDFGALRPGKAGQLTFSVPLRPGLTGAAGAKSFFVKATARISTANVPSGVQGEEVFATDSVLTKVSTQPSLAQSVLYDNGAGSGLLPPQTGQDTSFTVRWQIVNPGNDIRNARVTATLPPGAAWADMAAVVIGGSAPVYDRSTSTVAWTIGTIPFGTGNGMPKYEATFKVSIHPSDNQISQSVPLTANTVLAGTDSFTGQSVQVSLRSYTTDDVDNHPNDGRVQ